MIYRDFYGFLRENADSFELKYEHPDARIIFYVGKYGFEITLCSLNIEAMNLIIKNIDSRRSNRE